MEALGTAASVAGLVGLSGQLLSGIIFLKDFVSDVKNAPDDVKSLSREIKTLADSAKQAESLIADCVRYGVQLDEAEYKAAFEQCLETVEKMGVMIEKDVKSLGGKAKWLGRLKSAAGKKQLESYMFRVERAKTQMMMVESKVALKLQQQHQLTLIQTTTSIQSIKNESRTATTWSKSMDGRLDGLSTEIMDIKSQLRKVTANIGGVYETMPTYSAMEAMIESVVSRELKKHQKAVASIEHNKIHSSPPWILSIDQSSRTDIFAIDSNQMMSIASGTTLEALNHPVLSRSMSLQRQDKVLYRSRFRAPFLQIDIKTTEVRRRQKPQNNNQYHSNLRITYKQKFTEYHIQINLPFWKSFCVFKTGNMNQLYGSNLRSLKTYNHVPWDAPIFKACRALNLSEVRRLFEIGAASPTDVLVDGGSSLIDSVLYWYSLPTHVLELVKKSSEWLAFLTFLINSSGGEIETDMLCRWLFRREISIAVEGNHSLLLTETVRLIAAHNAKDPFEDKFACAVINDPLHPLYPIISSQDNWWIESDLRTYDTRLQGYFIESTRDMIMDPLGKSLRRALSEGMKYVVYSYLVYFTDYVDDIQYAPYHSLLTFTAGVNNETITRACIARLAILLEYQYDPRRPYRPKRSWRLGLPSPHLALSSTAYAEFFGLQQTWESALVIAGWSSVEIEDLKDEDTFLGVPDLLNGNVVYSTLIEQRVAFIDNLRCGFFVDMNDDEVKNVADLMRFELDTYDLKAVIAESSSCFRQYSTPGGWLSGEEIRLEPGVDFQLPWSWINCENDISRDWKCIRDRWPDIYHITVHHCLFPASVSIDE